MNATKVCIETTKKLKNSKTHIGKFQIQFKTEDQRTFQAHKSSKSINNHMSLTILPFAGDIRTKATQLKIYDYSAEIHCNLLKKDERN